MSKKEGSRRPREKNDKPGRQEQGIDWKDGRGCGIAMRIEEVRPQRGELIRKIRKAPRDTSANWTGAAAGSITKRK